MEEFPVEQKRKRKKRPDITIRIQSWTTPIVGVVMLIIGFLGGYYGRSAQNSPSGEQAAAPQAQINAPAPAAPAPSAGNAELMDYVTSQARHFRGAENAAVTLIEFGDFQ